MTRTEQRNQKRQAVVEAIAIRGEAVSVVARVYGLPLRTVFDWLARYRQGGWPALKDQSRQGRPKKVSGEILKWIYDAVTQGNPFNYKLPFCLWSANTLRSVLAQEWGIKLSKASVCRLLGHLGLSPQRPLYKAYRQDPVKVKAYLNETFPMAVAEAKQYGARLYFVDEAAFRSDAHRGTTWGKIGETPVVKDSGGRFGVKLISAVSARGDLHFDVIEDTMDAHRFIDFLKKLRQDAGCPVFVIADNAKYHHSKVVKAFLETEKGQIMMAFLPPYSPELNPDELVWNQAKAEVGKRCIVDKAQMRAMVCSVLQDIQNASDRVQSFFRTPTTRYASEYA